MAVQNTGNSAVLFDQDTSGDNLITAQLDPSQPQVQGLTSVTDPLVTDQHISKRMTAFDPEQFDLSDSSTLMRFMTALLAGAGIGGVRRQEIISRMSSTLAGTNFMELDGFWGSIFSLGRSPEETLPLNADGLPLNPSTDVTDSATWDMAQARDGRYRSRIEQLAAGVAMGATYNGVSTAARAILNCEVEVIESWLLADYANDGTVGYIGNTWLAVQLQYGTWGNLNNVSWGSLALGGSTTSSQEQAPLGNRGEVIIVPGREITESERYQLHLVLNKIVPAGVMVSISDNTFVTENTVACRSVAADSVNWDVVSYVTQAQAVQTSGIDLYPGSSSVESGRPAMGSYSGESWSINGRIASVQGYAEDAFGEQQSTVDFQTVVYADGSSHDYAPEDAIIDSRKLALARAASEGVATTFPYAEGRFS